MHRGGNERRSEQVRRETERSSRPKYGSGLKEVRKKGQGKKITARRLTAILCWLGSLGGQFAHKPWRTEQHTSTLGPTANTQEQRHEREELCRKSGGRLTRGTWFEVGTSTGWQREEGGRSDAKGLEVGGKEDEKRPGKEEAEVEANALEGKVRAGRKHQQHGKNALKEEGRKWYADDQVWRFTTVSECNDSASGEWRASHWKVSLVNPSKEEGGDTPPMRQVGVRWPRNTVRLAGPGGIPMMRPQSSGGGPCGSTAYYERKRKEGRRGKEEAKVQLKKGRPVEGRGKDGKKQAITVEENERGRQPKERRNEKEKEEKERKALRGLHEAARGTPHATMRWVSRRKPSETVGRANIKDEDKEGHVKKKRKGRGGSKGSGDRGQRGQERTEGREGNWDLQKRARTRSTIIAFPISHSKEGA